MVKLGLVTVLYNSNEVLEGFLQSLAAQDYKNYILYLVDNSADEATDQLLTQLLQCYPVTAHKHLKSGGNIGVAAGNNLGIKQAMADDCDDVVLLNNDIEIVEPFVLSKLVKMAAAGDALLVPKILYYDNRAVWMAGGYMDKIRALGVHYEGADADAPRFNKPKYITYAPTCFMYVKGEVFRKTGIMDERYFAYCDDTDFVYRALKDGYRLFYEPSLTILHKVSSSSGGDSSLFYIYYSNRNKIYFIRKHYRGFRKWFAIGYMLAARTIFWLRFNKEQRKKLVQAIKDGFRMPLKLM
jgi:GT2 family glycosyltransferase